MKLLFLHKVKNGAVDKSYGIHVARLAKMPEELLNKAEEILNEYDQILKRKILKKKYNLQWILNQMLKKMI